MIGIDFDGNKGILSWKSCLLLHAELSACGGIFFFFFLRACLARISLREVGKQVHAQNDHMREVPLVIG
jgi:hypothetical protein